MPHRTIPVRQLIHALSALPPGAAVVVARESHPLLAIERPCRITCTPVKEVLVVRGPAVVTQPAPPLPVTVREAVSLAADLARDAGLEFRQFLVPGPDQEPLLTCDDARWLWEKLECGKDEPSDAKGPGGIKLAVDPPGKS
jgi:hypothetical protein